MNLLTEIIGYAAATAGTLIMVPQVVKSIQSKHVADLSWGMIYVYNVNCLLWTIYGYLIWAMPVLICNVIGMCVAMLLFGIKRKYS